MSHHPYRPNLVVASTDTSSEDTSKAEGRYISELIRERIQEQGKQFFSNDNISEFMSPGVLKALQEEVTVKFQAVLDALLIDTQQDHNSQDTAKRWAKMMLTELFAGRYTQAPEVTVFPNVKRIDQMYVVGPIESRSSCAHHLVPIIGQVWVAVIPNEKLIGLSKFHRTVDHISSRPQIQEEMTEQIADTLEALTEPRGLAVAVCASHLCCGHRGVKDNQSKMITTVLRGSMKGQAAREEFMSYIKLSRES